MKKITLIALSSFGLEALVKKELRDLGFFTLGVSDGRVEFESQLEGIPRANLWLRVADRVVVKLAEFPAKDFDALYEGAAAVAWEDWIPRDAKITVTGKSVKSQLASVRTNQSMVKKAMVERLKKVHALNYLPEKGAEYTIQIALHKDVALLTLDTSGAGLHKRGYRTGTGEAPLRENLAAALVTLSGWNGSSVLMDPMCGAGTILIEAALKARNIAPGLNRQFAAEDWPILAKDLWMDARYAARQAIVPGEGLRIHGYDINPERISDSHQNARRAGVHTDVHFEAREIKNLRVDEETGVMITNPPYGIKLGSSEELPAIYEAINQTFIEKNGWSLFILTADKTFPQSFKRGKPTRTRKLYNGPIEVHYYQYERE